MVDVRMTELFYFFNLLYLALAAFENLGTLIPWCTNSIPHISASRGWARAQTMDGGPLLKEGMLGKERRGTSFSVCKSQSQHQVLQNVLWSSLDVPLLHPYNFYRALPFLTLSAFAYCISFHLSYNSLEWSQLLPCFTDIETEAGS